MMPLPVTAALAGGATLEEGKSDSETVPIIINSNSHRSLQFMKKLIRYAVAGALMASYATAQAQNLPSSGNADLWLWVTDTTTKTTFAEDTGVSLSSLVSNYVSGAKLNTTANVANFTVAESSALATFLSSTGSDTLEWAVSGAQYQGTTGNSANVTAGNMISVFDAPSTLSGKVAGMVEANLVTIGGGLQGDLTYMSTTYTAGGTTYALSNGTAGGNAWGTGDGNTGGSTNLYGVAIEQAGIALGASENLYGATANGNKGGAQTYILGTNLTLSSAGVLSVSSGTITTPLPAAVWLFGSGLLGLVGVGRRRSVAAA